MRSCAWSLVFRFPERLHALRPRVSRDTEAQMTLVHLSCVSFFISRELSVPLPPSLLLWFLWKSWRLPSLCPPGIRLWDSSQIVAAAPSKCGFKKVSRGHQKTLVAGYHLGQIQGATRAPSSPHLKFTEMISPVTTEKICKFPSWFCFFNSGWRIKEVFNTMPPLCCYVTYIPFMAQDKLE